MIDMATYTFKPGKKASSPLWDWSFLIGKTRKVNRIDFTFNISSSFLLSAEEIEALGNQVDQWLKIGGITWYKGFLGWLFNRNDKEALLLAFRHRVAGEKLIEVTPYVNNNFDWDNGPVIKIKPDTDYSAYIERSSAGNYAIGILDEDDNWIVDKFQIDEQKYVEILPPFHGGRWPAQRRKTLKFAFDVN